MTSKGQVTIPKDVRDRMGLNPGDQIAFFSNDHGGVDLIRKRPITELLGSLPNNGVHLTDQEIDAAIDEFHEMRAKRG